MSVEFLWNYRRCVATWNGALKLKREHINRFLICFNWNFPSWLYFRCFSALISKWEHPYSFKKWDNGILCLNFACYDYYSICITNSEFYCWYSIRTAYDANDLMNLLNFFICWVNMMHLLSLQLKSCAVKVVCMPIVIGIIGL